MAKKKLRDCTIGEIKRFEEKCKERLCTNCPLLIIGALSTWYTCYKEVPIERIKGDYLDIEIEMPEEGEE